MSMDKETARATRLEIYAGWLADDADGIAAAVTMPNLFPGSAAILTEARALVAQALHTIDAAIERTNQENR